MSAQASSRADRCLIWARGAVCPSPLLRGLAARGLAPEVVASAPEVMLALARRPARAVLLVEPAGQHWVDDLLSALARYHPQVACWRYDPISGLQSLRGGGPKEGDSGTAGTSQVAAEGGGAAPQEEDPGHSTASAASASSGEDAAEGGDCQVPEVHTERRRPLPAHWPFDLPERQTAEHTKTGLEREHGRAGLAQENGSIRSAALLSEEELAMLLEPLEDETDPL